MATTLSLRAEPEANPSLQLTPDNTPPWAYYHLYRGCRIDATATMPPELRPRYEKLWKDAHTFVRGKLPEAKDLQISVVSSFHISYKDTTGNVVSLYEDSIKGDKKFYELMLDVRNVAMRTLRICGDSNPETVCHRPLAPSPFHRFWSDERHKQLTEKALSKLKKDPQLLTQWQTAQAFAAKFQENLTRALQDAEAESKRDLKKIKQLKALLDTPIDSYAIMETLRLYDPSLEDSEKCRTEIRQHVCKFLLKEFESDIKENPYHRSEVENYSLDVRALGLNREDYLRHVEEHETEMHGGSLTEFVAFNLLHRGSEEPTDEQALGMLGMHTRQEASAVILEALQIAKLVTLAEPQAQPQP